MSRERGVINIGMLLSGITAAAGILAYTYVEILGLVPASIVKIPKSTRIVAEEIASCDTTFVNEDRYGFTTKIGEKTYTLLFEGNPPSDFEKVIERDDFILRQVINAGCPPIYNSSRKPLEGKMHSLEIQPPSSEQ